jgi:hypothetical protein
MKLRRIVALAGAVVLTLWLAGTALADSGSPTSITTGINALEVTVSGTWTWEAQSCNNNSDKIVGWAVAWGEPGYTANPVPKVGGGSYFMGDSVQGNTVFTAGATCTSFPGDWGPLSHTYAAPGHYDICVIIYDLRDPAPATGAHSKLAGGADRNTDNSVEENFIKDDSICKEASVTVDHAPSVSIEKTAEPTTLPATGGSVTFSYLVTNTGDVKIDGVTVTDDNGTPGDTSDDWTADCPNDSLDVDESMTCTSDPVAFGANATQAAIVTTNIGKVTATWDDCNDGCHATVPPAEDDATVTVEAPGPAIKIVKTPSTTTLPVGGGSVTYTYVVTNIGAAPLTNVTLVDDECSNITGPTGDTIADSILALTETWTYLCTTTLTETTTNTAVATGHDGDTTVTDTDEAVVTVEAPQGGVGGETSVPTEKPPRTDTLSSTTTDAGGSFPLALIILGVIVTAAMVVTPHRAKR